MSRSASGGRFKTRGNDASQSTQTGGATGNLEAVGNVAGVREDVREDVLNVFHWNGVGAE